MSTLVVVEKILRETAVPMSVREIVEYAGESLPTRSKTPDTVVARDLSMDIKKKGEDSLFVRTAPGRYTMRELHLAATTRDVAAAGTEQAPTPVLEHAMPHERVGAVSTSPRPERAKTNDGITA